VDGPDEIIHQSTRLRIAATLNAAGARERLEFNELKAILKTTDGNLGTHLNTLEKAGYVKIEKDFVGKKPRTRVSFTIKGRRAYESHIAYLRDLIQSGNGQ
jgi:DNA-binding MarR family transcriptional regulator